ncbi:MAG: coniferyl-aldehyde dehydrogenase [Gammaproteobacteria bacterium CG22_combo_CG10-13_8_21_14_all_40_8]|nr:MAG: coniferyl-aldehyde dehydrogenase [Gammaproteobacteria bacterium CG22_combo_CG10-13_8_21_14_all_40_8]
MQDLHEKFLQQRQAYNKTPFANLSERLQRLSALEAMLNAKSTDFAEAIARDFGCRHVDETHLLEVYPSLAGLRHAKRHLKKWMKLEKRSVAWTFQPAKARVMYQPLGVVGIIVPWNYPLFLAIGPMIAAIAAGNHMMVKISESTPQFGEVFAKAIAEYFPDDFILVVNGDVEIAQAFTELPFDHLLFTGSTSIGKKVMASAAQNLTPVTLELGGKSPTLLDRNIDLDKTCQRVIITKLFNAGQTCVAPDYVLIPEEDLEGFITSSKKWAAHYYPKGLAVDFTSIINEAQYQRQSGLVEELRQNQIRLEPLFDDLDDDTNHKIVPQLAINPDNHLMAMRQEIFGPLLPVVTYKNFEAAIQWINERDRPLALYFFSQNKKNIQTVLEQTHAGGVAINECLLHVAQENLPFGGVGPSGMGHYHGKDGFLTFSKGKGIFYQSSINGAGLLTPPYKGFTKTLLKWLLRWA